MKTFFKPYSLTKLSVVTVSSWMLLSCGSGRETAYNDNDGIYNSSVVTHSEQNSNYYQQYFRTKAQQYEQVVSETDDLIFTDIESYTSSGYVDENGTIYEEYSGGYGGWGDTSSEVTINVYPNYSYGYF